MSYPRKMEKHLHHKRKYTTIKKPTKMQTTQNFDLFVTYREGFDMMTQNNNKNQIVVHEKPSSTQNSMSPPFFLDSVRNENFLPPLKD